MPSLQLSELYKSGELELLKILINCVLLQFLEFSAQTEAGSIHLEKYLGNCAVTKFSLK